MSARIRIQTAAAQAKRRALHAVASSGVGELLVSQALRRIRNRGDSTHRYPELWATREGKGYRAGGAPLQDTGRGMQSLSSRTEVGPDSVTFTLQDGAGYMVYHQNGYKTRGPNLVPLTRRFLLSHVKGENPHHETDSAGVGFRAGVDFIMFWNGVDVPQRKIFNMPPEDRREIDIVLGRAVARGA